MRSSINRNRIGVVDLKKMNHQLPADTCQITCCLKGDYGFYITEIVYSVDFSSVVYN